MNNLSAANSENAVKKNVLAAVRGVIISLVLSFVLFAVLAAVMLWSGMGEEFAGTLTIAVSVISILTGSFIAARRIGERGWLYGAVCGLVYYLIVYICALSAMMEFNFSTKTLIMFAVGVLCGMIGGMIGVNSGGGKRRR